MGKRRGGKRDRVAREAASRARRAQHATAAPVPAARPVTEASVKLVAALEAAGLHRLADRARALEFDDYHSPHAMPAMQLVTALVAAGATELAERVKAGEFDATKADADAWYSSEAGRAEAAEFDRLLATIPPDERERYEAVMRLLASEDPMAKAALARMRAAADEQIQHAASKQLEEQVYGALLPDDGSARYAEQLRRLQADPAAQAKLADAMGLEPAGAPAAAPDRSAQRAAAMHTDVVLAAYQLAERSGAVSCQIGFLHDDVPIEQADWYGVAEFRGARIMVEHHASPSAAALALAERLLYGATCKCGDTVTLADDVPGCRWRLMGQRWEPGCSVPAVRVQGRRGDTAALAQAARARRAERGRQ